MEPAAKRLTLGLEVFRPESRSIWARTPARNVSMGARRPSSSACQKVSRCRLQHSAPARAHLVDRAGMLARHQRTIGPHMAVKRMRSSCRKVPGCIMPISISDPNGTRGALRFGLDRPQSLGAEGFHRRNPLESRERYSCLPLDADEVPPQLLGHRTRVRCRRNGSSTTSRAWLSRSVPGRGRASGFCVGWTFLRVAVGQPFGAGADREQPVRPHLRVVIGELGAS